MKVWIYRRGDDLLVFASQEIAQAWLDKHDPEGVAFVYSSSSGWNLLPSISSAESAVIARLLVAMIPSDSASLPGHIWDVMIPIVQRTACWLVGP